jgi:hypothetical protein
LVAALAKRTLLASSSASLRSSAVRSGARLNINGLVYHRRVLPPLLRRYLLVLWRLPHVSMAHHLPVRLPERS